MAAYFPKTRYPFLRRILPALLTCALWLAPAAATAQIYMMPPSSIKAAFIFNFLKFIELPSMGPASESTTINICIPPGESFENMRPIIDNKTIEGQRIIVQPLKPDSDLSLCQVVFIDEKCDCEKTALQRLFGKRILSIGESDTFLANGGMISFFIKDSKVRFEISARNIEREQLQVSSKLLSLSHARE